MPRTLTLLSLLLLSLVMLISPAAAATDIMPVAEIHEGMKGVGKTVILGTEIQDFDVEVLGVLERGGFNGGPMILVRGSGPVLDATGGFAGGYSGSPIYINGRMIGAISAAWFFADHSIAGVTPIEEMLKNLHYPTQNQGNVAGELTPMASAMDLEGTTLEATQIAMAAPPSFDQVAADAAGGVMTLTPCKTPLFVNGLNPELIEKIRAELGPKMPYIDILPGLGPSAASGGTGADGASVMDLYPGLQPGAAIGAQLVTGDIDLTAIGTLTYIDENQVLAFGHPFLQVGAVELPLTKARIVHTMSSIQRSFKMGEATSLVGTINQDRAAAISGTLGEMPKMIPFHLIVKDTDLDRTRRFNYNVVDYEAILPFLGLLPPMQGLGEVMDRQGPASIRSHFKIVTDELDPIERSNLFYDQSSGVGFMELAQALFLLTTQNIFQEIHVKEVFVDVDVTQNRQTSDIIKAEILGDDFHTTPDTSQSVEQTPPIEPETSPDPNPTPDPAPLQEGPSSPYYDLQSELPTLTASDDVRQFKPGDKFTVEVHLKPYRQPEKIEHLTITIPRDMPTGQTMLEIRGGGRLPSIFQVAPDTQGLSGSFMGQGQSTLPEPPESLQDLIDEFNSQEKMNELVAELYRPAGGQPEAQAKAAAKRSAEEKARASEGAAGVRDFTEDQAGDREDTDQIKEVITTDRVIFGSVVLPIEIVNKEKKVAHVDAPPAQNTDNASDEPAPKSKHKAHGPGQRFP